MPTKKIDKKRLLVILAIFGLPILLIVGVVFSLLRHRPASAAKTEASNFNAKMPAPTIQQNEKNKLELYLDAEKDSLRRQQALHSDPYAKAALPASPLDSLAKAQSGSTAFPGGGHPAAIIPQDTNERKVNEHLARLYAALRSSPEAPPAEDPLAAGNPSAPRLPGGEVDRLERLEAGLRQQDTASNPQLQQINSLLDKVLAIQHPDRQPQQGRGADRPTTAYPVSARLPDSLPAAQDSPFAGGTGNGFYGLSSADDTPRTTQPAIRAVVHADQTIQTGSVVKLRLLQDIYIKGARIPANAFIFGPCSINNERVEIHLSQVQYEGQLYPIDMKVFDGADGLEGLYVPGAISREVIKEGAAEGVSTVGLTSLDPSIGAQAAAAGIETAKTLFSRKVRLITATLKAGDIAILEPAQSSK